MKLTVETCIDAISVAVLNRRGALQIELAVGLALFHEHSGASRDARRILCEVYASSGYQCLNIQDSDYKTINRRINATADLYEKLPIVKWIGKLYEQDMLRAVQLGLQPYEFLSYADVVRFCEPTAASVQPKTKVPPAPDVLQPTSNHTGLQKVTEMFRRAGDELAKDARHIETEHLVLVIPQVTTRAEMIDLAMKLLEMAKAVDNMVTNTYPSETPSPKADHHERSTESTH